MLFDHINHSYGITSRSWLLKLTRQTLTTLLLLSHSSPITWLHFPFLWSKSEFQMDKVQAHSRSPFVLMNILFTQKYIRLLKYNRLWLVFEVDFKWSCGRQVECSGMFYTSNLKQEKQQEFFSDWCGSSSAVVHFNIRSKHFLSLKCKF